ncbi:MAG: alpha/beta hydrolase [Anaerolineae bacterium]|jgi:pimeloyl-ACP methyl ester carboxylesterase|nr:alpha/beta hydrolase [Anaerolineae bacterium]
MSEWLSKDIVVNGLKVHYYRTGGNKPPFVLAHGATDDGLCWTPIAKVLEKDYDVIMVDALGHGLSDSPEGPNPTAKMGSHLAAVIQALEIEKPLVMGHSMGAATALALGGLHPDLPKAILLEDPPALWKPAEPRPEPPEDGEKRPSMMDWFNSLRTKTREEIMADGRTQNPDWPEEEFGPWADSKMRFAAHDPNKPAFGGDFLRDISEIVAKITCPTLLMYADHEKGAIVQEKDLAIFKELVPQAVVKQIKGAGHNIRRDQYDAFMTVVQDFLAGLEA